MKAGTKPNIFLCAAAVLLCLVLISTHFTAGMYARFTSGARSADTARAAAFRTDAQLIPANEGGYRLTFANNAETSVRYSVTVTLQDGVVNGQVESVTLGSQTKAFDGVNGERSVTFEDVGTLAPGAQAQETLSLLLNAQFDDQSVGAGNQNYIDDYDNDSLSFSTGDCPFTVTVGFVQVN